MSTTEQKSGLSPFKVLVAFFLLLAIGGVIAWWGCHLSLENSTNGVLNRARDVQRTWLDKSLDTIRVWRNEIVEQARYISASEMFRLFVMDAKRFTPAELDSFSDPDALHSSDEETRTMAEQLVYMQDLLKDFTARRAWSDARILLTDASKIVGLEFAVPLTPEQKELAIRAGQSGRPSFGPIRRGQSGLVMDMADPLFEVLGTHDAQPIAVLLLTVPLEKPLLNFLSSNREQQQTLLPRIIDRDINGLTMALASGNGIVLEPVVPKLENLESLPFERRESLNGKLEVYSMAGRPTMLDWLFVLETPAAEVDSIIDQQKTQIYGLGAVCDIGFALLVAFFWARHTSRKEKARADVLDKLNQKISQQRQMLSCINKSNLDGLVLVDPHKRIEVCNPAFLGVIHEIDQASDFNSPDLPNLSRELGYALQDKDAALDEYAQRISLSDVLPGNVLTELDELMAEVNTNGKPTDRKIEVLPKDGGPGLVYRVNVYPFKEDSQKDEIGGSLATIRNITPFIRADQARRARQQSLVRAIARAAENVDPNLVGHSDKMAGVAALLADRLDMNDRRKDTLLLASRLSQIGKIQVPREILTKKGRLTPDELKEMQRAPEHADKILNEMNFDLPVRETVGEMGERMDGSGKPNGLTGDKISLEGRALAIIDAFIAMTSSRGYRAKMSMDQAIAQLQTEATHFDPDIVALLAKIARDQKLGGQLKKIIGETEEA